MDPIGITLKFSNYSFRCLTALLCVGLLVPGDSWAWAAQQETQAAAAPVKISNAQLDSLVAPIALYPDPMLAQVLAASTYPLELVQLQQWLAKNKNLKDKALADAVMKQKWDPSVQGLAPMPDLVKRLADDVKWTTDLGNAFLAQQSEVMDAVQRMRAKAKDKGNLKSSEQQKVETRVVENKTVIVVEQSNPQVVYVPSYDPVVVYGAPAYPYPPIYYPPAGYYAAGMAISFGVGMAMGAAWGGGWGYNSNWGGNNNININNNNNFVNNSNRVNGGNRNNVGSGNRGGNNWQHNPQHRGAAPYGDRSTANKFGGTTRGDSAANRQANARQNQGLQQAGKADRSAGGGNAGANRDTGNGNRAGSGGGDRGNTGNANRGGSGGGDRGNTGSANRAGSGGGDRVGNRSVPSSSGSRNSDAFSGASSRSSGSSASRSSSRGSSSMGSRGGGGGSRGGGGGGRRR